MESVIKASKMDTTKSLIFLATSFILAFCIQVTVHELSHYLTGIVVGAKGGHAILHPFYNSQVTFSTVPNSTAQVLIGIMGPIMDIILSSLIAFIAWKKKSVLTLPLLMWASIAFIGEGIGMITSVAAYPYWIEDITQLMRIGVSGTPIITVSVVFVIIGLIWMVLITPLAGISLKDSFIKRLLVYICCLPLYFGMAIVAIKIFNKNNADILDVRFKQFAISIIFSIVLAIFHKQINWLTNKIIHPKEVIQPKWSDVRVSLYLSIGILITLIGYSNFFN